MVSLNQNSMKTKILIAIGALVTLLFILFSVGFQVGDVTIGKRENEIQVKQKSTLDESPFSKDYLQSNKVICLNLWATWCGPCVKEMPMLNSLKKRYEAQNITFISMSIDSDTLKLRKFLQSNTFSFTDIRLDNLEYSKAILNYLEDRPLDKSIMTQSVPKTYLIKNGKVIFKIDGMAEEQELAAAIDKALRD